MFRGSVSGGNDWSTNYKLYRTKLEDVKDTKTDLGLGEFGNIGLHYGFASKFSFTDEIIHLGSLLSLPSNLSMLTAKFSLQRLLVQ